MSPSTEIKKGDHLSVKTEFKAGVPGLSRLPIGSVRIRKETHTGSMRAWVKIADPNVWKKRSILVWESEHGPLPKGWVVHHDDRNSMNDDISNLIGMTRRDHAAEHRDELNMSRGLRG